MSAQFLIEVTLFVRDVDASADFYRAIGIDIVFYDEPGVPHFADGTLDASGTVLQLYPARDRPVTNVKLGIRVQEIDSAARPLTALGIDFDIPGPHRLRTVDPDGNRVHLNAGRHPILPARQ